MLVLVPDAPPHLPWIQILGRIAIHGHGQPRRLTGSGQRLLAVLVAAGSEGTTAERIAEEIWADQQPNPWRPALRMAVARLRKQLPDGWDIVADGGVYRIATRGGWIDAWRLEEYAAGKREIDEEALAWMLAGPPFADIDGLEMVLASTQHLGMLQITVAERFCDQTPTTMTTDTCSVLTALLRDHPYNDRLALTVGRALSGAGRGSQALGALRTWADGFVSDIGSLPAPLADFLARTDDEVEQPTPAIRAVERPVQLPKELRHLVETPMYGRDAELDRVRGLAQCLITGPTGSGKSRLLAELIADDPEIDTTYVAGDDHLRLPLGPFAGALPSVRDELLAPGNDGLRGDWTTDREAAARAWRVVLAHLEARGEIRPQRLIVDDAHLLDGASLSLVRLLTRSNTTRELSIVISGQSDYEETEWTAFVQGAERGGLGRVELGGLGLDALENMIQAQFPDASRPARQGLARDIQEASDGLPAVAGPLIAAADPLTLALPERVDASSALARATATLSPVAGEVAHAAAVLGQQFSIGALIELSSSDENTVFAVLDELWAAGLITETEDPDVVRFKHSLIQRAFVDAIPRFRRGQLHRRAVELTSDPHERAEHYANAGALSPATKATEALLESAWLHAEARQWRKVCRQLRRVADLGGELGARAQTLWARALDLSGADGSTQRKIAYDLAVAGHDWGAALDAALSGLPEAEPPDGDAQRVEMLEGIDAAQLDQARRFDRVFYLSRLQALAGEHDLAMTYATQARSLATNPDEVALSHACLWIGTRHIEPEPRAIPDDVVHSGTLRVRTWMALLSCLSHAERGDFANASEEAVRFDGLAGELGDPVRIWQSMTLQSMFALNDGDLGGFERLTRAALEFADLHSIQGGTTTYVGQLLFSYTIQRRLPELVPALHPFRSDLAASMLGRAGLAVLDDSIGLVLDPDDVRSLVTEALSKRTSFSLALLAFLANLLPRYAPELAPQVLEFFLPFGDSPILVGHGFVNAGPAVMFAAAVCPEPEQRRTLALRGIAAADRHGPLLWRVCTRRNLAESGDETALEEALALATGTQLEAAVQRVSG